MKNRIKHYSSSPVSDDAVADLPAASQDADDTLDDEALDLSAPGAGQAIEPIIVEIPEALHGERLDKALAKLLPDYSRSRLQQWIDAGAVRVGGAAVRPRAAVCGGDRIEVVPQRADDENAFVAEPVDLDVVYEDDTLLVINKPAGLVVHPAAGNWSGTVLNGLLHRYPQAAGLPRAGIVHRLDKETSGLMVVARTLPAQTDLVRQLQARTVKRTYLALVWGETPEAGTIDAPIGRDPRDRTRMAIIETASGKPARTHFKTLDVVDLGRAQVSLVQCQLETGRTHQIRVHFESEGHPLLGDPVYTRNFRRGRPQTIKAPLPAPFARQALHAVRLGLVHPASGQSVHWHAGVPDDLAELMDALEMDPDVDLV
ncbi:RluA family pseudouridine synthase [Ralstonia pseudosolanacearum]|uniref:RluA family pseudouridine synthase n=1 Tax=Ralstonia pseudosolanacearum TaxID=1310165 RepID=UPI0026775CEC|nr:RluA family pseudouridine synthase [Ralstonia pseudosolanacearum]MDO3524073.1 RluA family pseudouridine synthase [Ralstonia pseudosolanacearum]MDO3548027.1 RluA family pseudouridine synthase [Ralstonia pseudosolanacearum]MDO3552468.1 RluA family pseudouridine synthase [Ralstonia pseudosolanacearum]MDO3567722.1 RluA family pseudouridine synthase [Ralstonia pseudosolanacearum]MDO3582782.1 RluA family pseudouridine synthase [Ralstonia pseudosolanacearum]